VVIGVEEPDDPAAGNDRGDDVGASLPKLDGRLVRPLIAWRVKHDRRAATLHDAALQRRVLKVDAALLQLLHEPLRELPVTDKPGFPRQPSQAVGTAEQRTLKAAAPDEHITGPVQEAGRRPDRPQIMQRRRDR
jgi:hypothetical protein